MASYEGIARNFRLMVAQVTKQLVSTRRLLDKPDPQLRKAIQDADDYVDIQKSMIENECFSFISRQALDDEQLVDSIRAISIITSNLERFADLAVNIARQMQHLGEPSVLHHFDYAAYFEPLFEGLGLVVQALFDRDSSLALRICQTENQLDRLYRADLEQIIAALRTSRESDRLITALFILHYLERMGDALLNIGEAIVMAVLGERLKIRQYRVLEDALASSSKAEPSIHDVGLASIWGTRSGVRVGTVEEPQSKEKAERVLFKEGNPAKLKREKDSLQRWGQLAPGLAPAIVEYRQRDSEAALLLEYLDGATLQDLALNADPTVARQALDRLEETLLDLWTRSRKTEPVHGAYLQQLAVRIEDVYRMHPYLKGHDVHIGWLYVAPFATLMEQAMDIDESLKAPFSVFIHGDFNLDNIIFNPEKNMLHFVDVHRSRDMDYVQDVSVFLASSFRLPVFVPGIRRNLELMSLHFLRFVRDFARRYHDTTFEARLALGLARSFVTSTRYELNRTFAQTMHQRAIFLLCKLLNHRDRDWPLFQVPDSVIVY